MSSAALLAPHSAATRARVVVLDDDAVFRAVLRRLLERSGVEVVGAYGTIELAQRRISQGGVDAVTVDVVLRNESGLDFLRWVRSAYPGVKAVLVTAGTERGARTGVDAVLLGATALLTKPTKEALDDFETELTSLFQANAPLNRAGRRPVVPPMPPLLKPELRRELVAIGASTGGPPALMRLLRDLPGWMDAPIVITQHMPSLHLTYLAEQLTAQCGRPVMLARDGERLMRGHAYLAGNDRHVEVRRTGGRLFIHHLDAPPEHHCRPAVDPMFRSVAAACPGTAVGVVLTGMGTDGAKGAEQLRARSNPVLVQDEASSVVFGMPGATMSAGAADEVVPLERLALSVLHWMAWAPGGANR